jgi:hypothetical protein
MNNTAPRRHRASIHWSAEYQRKGLPSALRTIDPAWFIDEVPRHDEGWSLVCEFDKAPAEQGNPSLAYVHYLFETAPAARLIAGATLQLFERGTGKLAKVEIID